MPVLSNSQIKFPWFIYNIATRPLYLALSLLPIPVVGLVVEMWSDLAFARSGAILVCAAICCVYLNHFLSVETENIKGAVKSTHQIGSSYEEILRNLSPALQEDVRAKGAANLYSLLETAKVELPRLVDAKEKLVRVEFIAGISGTLIWAFGDFLPY